MPQHCLAYGNLWKCFVMLVFKSLDCGFKCRECYVRSVVFLFYDNILLNNSLSLLLIVIGCCCVQMYN